MESPLQPQRRRKLRQELVGILAMNFLLAAMVYGSVLLIWIRHYLPSGGSPFGPEDVDAMAKIIKFMWFRLLPALGIGYVLTSIFLGTHVLKTRHGTPDS